MAVLHKNGSGRTAHRATALGMLLCLVMAVIMPGLLAGCSVHAMEAPVLINEIVSSNSHSLTDPVLGSPDWIELYNSSNESVSLSGYRLTDKPDSTKGVLPDVTIPAGGYTVVYADKNGTQDNANACCVDFNLSKGGVKLYLLNAENIVVSQVAVPELPTDISYARRDDNTYGYCASPSPDAQNAAAGILDANALKNVLQAGSLRINEVLPKPEDGFPWAEVYNAGQTDVDLGDYCLTDLQSNPGKWHFPGGSLAPGQYAVVSLSGQDAASPEPQASFKLGSEETALYLYDVMGNPVSDMSWYKDLPKGISVLAGNLYTAFPTRGAENSKDTFASVEPAAMDSADPVRLSEVLPKNKYSLVDSDGDREEWVELYNSGAQAVNLKNYFLTDIQTDLFKWRFPDTSIGAQSYLIVFLSGKQSKAGELHASFRLSPGEGGVWFTSFGAGGLRTDEIALPKSIGDNISVGRDGQGSPQYYAQPTPGAANAKGFSDAALAVPFNKDGLYISEVSAAEKPRSGQNDWIELHNASSSDVDLAGYTLSDSADKPGLWKIPALTVKAGGYAVVEASSDPKNANTAGFGISPTGETLLLSDPRGELLDRFDTGVLTQGITSGRSESAGTAARVYFSSPTRGKANSAALSGYAATPVFSETSLYHSKAFEVSVSCATPGAKIYYTTDGSAPTSASKAYAGPVTISKSMPLRAVAYAGGCLPSLPSTQTYLFDSPHAVPVVCLTGKPGDMNSLLRFASSRATTKPEYAGYAEYYEKDGALGVAFPTGMRPKGRMSLANPQKSYTLALGSDFGQKAVTYPFFSGELKTFHQLTLRDSGQDMPYARMRDTLFHRISDGMDVTTIQTRIVSVYMNGQYEGLFDLEEEENPDYLASHYSVDPNKVDIINRNTEVMSGSIKDYNRILKMAKGNMADDKVFAEFAKYVDVDACTDYLVAQTYWGSGDIVNIRFWRAQDYSEKWQPLYFDLDYCLRYNNVNRNMFSQYLTPAPCLLGSDIPVNMDIFAALMKNAAWRDKFVQRYIQLAETQYAPDRVLKIFDSLKAEMEPEMARDIAKWHEPGSIKAWESQAAGLRSALAKRQSVALRQLQSFFHVSDATMQKYIAKYSGKS